MLLFYFSDFVHYVLWNIALPRMLAVYAIVGGTLLLQLWALDTAPQMDRWPPLRLARFFRVSRASGNLLRECWRHVWRMLRTHAALVAVLLAGLALRMRYLLHEGGDVEHFYFYASTVFTKIHFLYFHLTGHLPWPQDQLATFHLIMAPLWRAAYHFDWPQILSIKIPTYTADVLSTIVVYVLALQVYRRVSAGTTGSAAKGAGNDGSRFAPLAGSTVALVAAAVWYLQPWLPTATITDAQSHAVALLFFVLAVARWEKPWLAGIFLALAASTRLEFGIAGIVACFWYLRWRGLRDAGLYALTSLGLLGLIAIPYALADFTAFRWALGGHLLDRGEPLLLVQEVYRAFGATAPAWLESLGITAMWAWPTRSLPYWLCSIPATAALWPRPGSSITTHAAGHPRPLPLVRPGRRSSSLRYPNAAWPTSSSACSGSPQSSPYLGSSAPAWPCWCCCSLPRNRAKNVSQANRWQWSFCDPCRQRAINRSTIAARSESLELQERGTIGEESATKDRQHAFYRSPLRS